jgi:hypothetical protein
MIGSTALPEEDGVLSSRKDPVIPSTEQICLGLSCPEVCQSCCRSKQEVPVSRILGGILRFDRGLKFHSTALVPVRSTNSEILVLLFSDSLCQSSNTICECQHSTQYFGFTECSHHLIITNVRCKKTFVLMVMHDSCLSTMFRPRNLAGGEWLVLNSEWT